MANLTPPLIKYYKTKGDEKKGKIFMEENYKVTEKELNFIELCEIKEISQYNLK